MSLDRHKYRSDPFKKHRRRIYSNLRVASEKLMAEYPSLSLRSGDLLCVNCLIAVTKHCSEAASEDAGPSGLSSQECALPTYSSTQDSDSSSDSDSPAGSPALHKINKMLSSQETNNKKQRINPRHLQLAIRNDEELNKLLAGVTIAQGGVLPYIQATLFPKKAAAGTAPTKKSQGEDA
ncbi:hypothetical protein EMCRGX_G004186 [Ephydatia muelleri]